MIKSCKVSLIAGSLVMSMGLVFLPTYASATTSASLGLANSFSILSSTYTNTVPGTTISGGLGYTTPPATAATVSGLIHVADTTYNQAGIYQGSALDNLTTQMCTFTFAARAVDLASDITHGLVGVYAPGVYCIDGAASVGTGGIILTGAGTHIFRMTGALNTAANSNVTLVNEATSCDVWWTPPGGRQLWEQTRRLSAKILMLQVLPWVMWLPGQEEHSLLEEQFRHQETLSLLRRVKPQMELVRGMAVVEKVARSQQAGFLRRLHLLMTDPTQLSCRGITQA